jgi:predicted transposase YdaD
MAKPADIGSKRLIGLAPNAWLQWVTQQPEVQARDILVATEFQWLSRATDAIIRAHSPRVGEFLVVNDIQLRYDPWIAWRTHAYAALAEEKYHLPAYAVVVNLLPPGPDVVMSTCYEHTLFGQTVRREFRVINLWEVDVEMVFRVPIPPLLPFVPLLRGGGTEAMVRQAARELRRDETLRDMETLLAFFARFALESRIIQQIMRWDMVVLQQSPWYQEILQEGILKGVEQGRQEGILKGVEQGRQEGILKGVEQGRQEGILKGMEQGRQEGILTGLERERLRTIQRALHLRFGPVPPTLSSHLETLRADQLEPLVEAAWLAPSLEAFVAQVPSAHANGSGSGDAMEPTG